jgi:hypothetical protein
VGSRLPNFGIIQHISERWPRKYQISWLEPEDWFFPSHSSLRWQSASLSIAGCVEVDRIPWETCKSGFFSM